MAFTPETDCLIIVLLELENITFEMIFYCNLNSNLLFLPGGHILKNQMVHMQQQNSVFSPHPVGLLQYFLFIQRKYLCAFVQHYSKYHTWPLSNEVMEIHEVIFLTNLKLVS